MTRQVWYVAHPLGGDIERNLESAKCWLRWLRRSFPETTFIAPWIAAVLSGEDDTDPAQRKAGLVDDEATVAICTGIVLCGGRISSGMARERRVSKNTADLSMFTRPPDSMLTGSPFNIWISRLGILQ